MGGSRRVPAGPEGLRVLRPALYRLEPEQYDKCIRLLGFPSVAVACSALVAVQRRLQRGLREAVGRYAPKSAVDNEIRALREILSHEISIDWPTADRVGALL
jgi:hypothetical protein